MRRIHLLTVIASLLLTAAGPAQAEDYNFRPGLWETTTTVQMKGMPEGMPGMPGNTSHTERHCVRKSDKPFKPESGQPQNQCKVKHERISASKMRWTVNCNNQGMISKGEGEMEYHGDKGAGHFTMTMTGGHMGPMEMKHSFTSRRIGDCK